MNDVKKTIRIEIAEWRLAEAKEQINDWGRGYIRGLELALEWIEDAERRKNNAQVIATMFPAEKPADPKPVTQAT